MTQRLMIRGGTVVRPETMIKADVLVENGTIAGIVTPDSVSWPEAEEIDAGGCYVLPGIVDPHTHIQLDTGIYQTADNWEIGTRVAAYGGVTTLVDFATQFEGMSFLEALKSRQKECRPAYIDYGLHMMITDPPADQHAYRDALIDLRDAGVPAIKLYTTYRPNYYMDDAALLHAFEALPDDMLAMVHCENDAMITGATRRLVDAGNTGWQFHGQSRPWQAEFEAVARVVHLASLARAAVYIVHCTHAQTVRHLLQMRQSFPEWRFLFETCVQYFTLDDMHYQGERPEYFILQPPLRSPESTEDMRQLQTLVDVVSTDHCDYTLAHKQAKNNFTVTPGGLPGLETVLPLVYTHTQLPEELKLRHIASRMAANPARIFGLYPRKGIIQPGSDADLVIYDPEPTITIRAEDLHTIGGYSPYDGQQVQGKVRTTISRGEIIVHEGEFRGTEGRGQFLKGTTFAMPDR